MKRYAFGLAAVLEFIAAIIKLTMFLQEHSVRDGMLCLFFALAALGNCARLAVK